MSTFDYVKYDEKASEDQATFKDIVKELEVAIKEHIQCPDSKKLAIRKLEEVYMWIGKGIRNDQIKRNGSAELMEGRNNG